MVFVKHVFSVRKIARKAYFFGIFITFSQFENREDSIFGTFYFFALVIEIGAIGREVR
jgi:hypothetical protein